MRVMWSMLGPAPGAPLSRGTAVADRAIAPGRGTQGKVRARRLHGLAPVTFAVALAACASPASPTGVATNYPTMATASGAAVTPDVASFGIPATIGGWRLVAKVKTMYPETADIIAAAGGNPSTAVDVDVQMSGLNFDALRAPGVTLDAFTHAAEPFLAGAGLTQRSVEDVAGRTVVRYATPADASGRSKAVFYTRRGDVIYATGYMTEAQLATLLAGLP
jgi:hypothetical protein